ncbi:MAG: BON domain-containing protein [Bacteriovorax sp.]|nr:BON domain-containing protein [Bacteriovorax sp.]
MSRNAHGSNEQNRSLSQTKKRFAKRKATPERLESRERLRHDHDLISEPDFHGRESSYRARAEYDNSFIIDDDREWKNAPSGDLSFEEQYKTDGEEHNYRWPIAENRVGEYPRFPDGLYRRTRTRKNFYGIGPKGYKRSDERIEEDVCELLTKDKNIDASEIVVEVKDGLVKLSGNVEDREDRVEAEMLVHSILGVEDIQNDISVKKRKFDVNLQ